MGVVAFSMVSIMGLLPVGLNLSKQAMTNTVESQIIQTVTNDLLLTNFSNISTSTALTYQYDNEGRIISTTASSSQAIYTAQVTFKQVNDSSTYPVSLQSTLNGTTTNEGYAVQVQITNKTLPNKTHTYSFLIANNNL